MLFKFPYVLPYYDYNVFWIPMQFYKESFMFQLSMHLQACHIETNHEERINQ